MNLTKIALNTISLYFILLSLALYFQPYLVYLHWVKSPFSDLNNPHTYGFTDGSVELIQTTTRDNVKLFGWHIMPRSFTSSSTFPSYVNLTLASRVFIYFHGNGGDIATFHRVDFYKKISAISGSHVVAIDYRGFGLSDPVTPSEEGLRHDAMAVFEYCISQGVDSRQIYLVGHSLGSGIATYLARELSTLGYAIGGLVLVSIPEAAMAYPIVPILYPLQSIQIARDFVKSISTEQWDSEARLAQGLKMPILLVHGTLDFEIPISHARRLFLASVRGLSRVQGVRVPKKLSLPEEIKAGVQNDHYTISTLRREALVLESRHVGHRVKLIELLNAGHNSVHAFEVFVHSLREFTI